MSAKLMGTIIQEVNLPYKEKWTLTILANYYNEKIGEAYPSIETISKNAGLSRSSIIRALTSLKEQGLITVKKRRRSGRFSQNVYNIHLVSSSHVSASDMAKNSSSKYQRDASPEVTGNHYPLKRSLKEPLSNYSVSKNQTTRLPETLEEFLKLPAILRKHYWFHKPDVRGMLHRAGIADLTEVL